MSVVDNFVGAIKNALPSKDQPADAWAATIVTAQDDDETEEKFGRLKQADIAWVADQLAVTQDAGIPLYRALALLASMRPGTSLSKRLMWMQRQMSEGKSLADTFRMHEDAWGTVTVALITAGEASGNMSAAFASVRELVEARMRLRRKLRMAMMYPSIVLGVTGVLVATLLFVVVPRFEEIYSSLGAELPSVTTTVIAVADMAPIFLAGLLIAGAALYVLLRRAKHDRSLRGSIDRFKVRIPIIGNLVVRGVQSRVASTIGILLSSGVPLLEVLRYASAAAGHVPVEDALTQIRTEIADGSTFAAALSRSDQFPELMVQLAAVGEESGSLAETMSKYARRTTEEVEQATSALTGLVEPLMMIMVGGVVGVFLMALYMPIISLSSEIG